MINKKINKTPIKKTLIIKFIKIKIKLILEKIIMIIMIIKIKNVPKINLVMNVRTKIVSNRKKIKKMRKKKNSKLQIKLK